MWEFQFSKPIVPISIHKSSKFIDRVTSISHNELECHALSMFGMGYAHIIKDGWFYKAKHTWANKFCVFMTILATFYKPQNLFKASFSFN